MIDMVEVREFVAQMLVMSPEEVGPQTSLHSLHTSLNNARLRVGLAKLGFNAPPAFQPATYGDLEAAVTGKDNATGPEPAPSSAGQPLAQFQQPATQVTAAPAGNFAVGLDIEEIDSLPETPDYWSHEFYRETFSPGEIAYAVVQGEPRAHFAGFWCAKEALRKCDPTYVEAPLGSIAVVHEPTGQPFLAILSDGIGRRLPYRVSISHSRTVATAVVIGTLTVAQPPASAAPEASAPKPPADSNSGEPVWRKVASLMLIAGAVVASAWFFMQR